VRSSALPAPTLARTGPSNQRARDRWEVTWDGFRAIVSTVDGLRVRSRRGWNMSELVPELAGLPTGLVLDGELVAWETGCRASRAVPLTYIAFDVPGVDGHHVMRSPDRRVETS
jgi:ATP-dependent DNA ligase